MLPCKEPQLIHETFENYEIVEFYESNIYDSPGEIVGAISSRIPEIVHIGIYGEFM